MFSGLIFLPYDWNGKQWLKGTQEYFLACGQDVPYLAGYASSLSRLILKTVPAFKKLALES